MSKLNYSQAEEIRKVFAAKQLTVIQLAKLHMCSRTTIYSILDGDTYPIPKRSIWRVETTIYAAVALGLLAVLATVIFF